MKKLRITFIFLSVLLLFNCVNHKNRDLSIIQMDFKKVVSIHDIDLIDSLDIVRLDNSVILGRINKIIKKDDRIYLLDAFITSSVFVYDTSGNLLKQIANRGEGPEEYLQPMDMFIDEKDNKFTLVSRTDRKLLTYNSEDLNLASVEKLPKPFFNVIPGENGYIGYMNNLIDKHPFNIWTMSHSLELKESFFEIPSSWDSKASGNIHPFSKYNNKVYCIQPYDFNIYSINEHEIHIAYQYDLGDHTWPSTQKEYEEVDRTRKKSPGRYIEQFSMFQETPDHLIVRTTFRHQDLLGIYNKNTRKSQVVKLDPYTDQYFLSFGNIIGMDENAIYSLVDAASMKKSMIGKDAYNDFESIYPVQIKNLRKKLEGIFISEEDNPFLLIHYFKIKSNIR